MIIDELISKQKMYPLRALCEEFACSVGKQLNWTHWFDAVGGLVDNKIARCLVVKDGAEYKGMLIFSFFPCLITGKLNATEVCFYTQEDARGQGLFLLKKMIQICKQKQADIINMSHFHSDFRVGELYKKIGFTPSENTYVLSLGNN